MRNPMYHKIYKKIKKYDTIVIARHVGPDPDAVGSQLGLRDIIKATFPNKRVYAVGTPASAFHYLGKLDKFEESYYENSLLITLDVPDKQRVDGVEVDLFGDSIKIDHHPFVEECCRLEWVDDSASSACQMVMELTFHTRLKMTKEAAEKLYIGLVSDTNRFLFYYTTSKTFQLVSRLIEETGIDFTKLYDPLYMRPLKEVKFESFLVEQMNVTENGFAYMTVDEATIKKYEVDPASAGNMVNNFNYIQEALVWAIFTEDIKNENIRASLRSRGPTINEVAATFGGGGHRLASGVRLKSMDEVMQMVIALDQLCKDYKEKNEES